LALPLDPGEEPADLDEELGALLSPPMPFYTVTIEGDAGRDPEVHFHAGGQGFWIAWMMTRLEARATLCAPFGGEPGLVLRTLIASEGVTLKAVAAQGWNGSYVHDRRSGERQPIVQVPSPALTRHEVDDLDSAMVAAGLAAGVAVLSGPSRPGVLPRGRLPSSRP
jgi:1-phosphofructokinase